MNLPLPETLRVEKPTGEHNAGLWYDKFFNQWQDDFFAPVQATKDEPDGKFKWIMAAQGMCGNREALAEYRQRIQRLTVLLNGQMLYFDTDGSFVTGLGREHPVENGFAWHHILGVPYLPGSSVKGLLRAYTREQEVPTADIDRIFGPDNRREIAIGSVIFFDAMPSAPVRLKADVMTPHYGPYYQDESGQTPPADWHDPTPIPFLVVADRQSFTFACAPRRPANKADRQDCEMVSQWLSEALEWLGAGAKTTVGYGRFIADQAANQAAAEEIERAREQREQEERLTKRLEGLSPLAQQLEREIELKQLDTDKDAFAAPPYIEDWLDRLEKDPAADALERFESLIRQHFPNLLENPYKTKGKKQVPAFNDRQRKIAERLNALPRQ
jgi:CRISPR-associated protein Cmr6